MLIAMEIVHHWDQEFYLFQFLIWSLSLYIECFFDDLRARTGVKSLIKKFAGVTHENLDKAFKEHQAMQINQNTNKECCE